MNTHSRLPQDAIPELAGHPVALCGQDGILAKRRILSLPPQLHRKLAVGGARRMPRRGAGHSLVEHAVVQPVPGIGLDEERRGPNGPESATWHF